MALLALFCLYFFRDPEREIPSGPVAVAPADGKVVAIRPEGGLERLSIFLNVFDVHVNRTPIGGVIEKAEYKEGKFLVASLRAVLRATVEDKQAPAFARSEALEEIGRAHV
jgi:phosphatidylserine decarboxylase